MSSTQTGTTRLRPLPQGSRYQLLLRIASGGMATVYLGRLKASAGFWKLRAIKRAHAHLIEDDELRNHMIAEARLCARIEHPNVVAMQDVEELSGELLLIMDYVEGTSLVELLRHYVEHRQLMPPVAAVRLVLDAAAGLEAAHALTDDHGQPLGLVHRDVSPQNILVGRDGVAKVADFGIAKCMQASGMVMTNTGGLKGKVGYMSPEYVRGTGLDARADVFALGVVLWELLCGRRLFRGANELVTLQQVASMPAARVSSLIPTLGKHIEAVVSRALEKKPDKRFQSMASFARALHGAAIADKLLGDHGETQRLMGQLFGARLERRRAMIRQAVAELDGGAELQPAVPRPAAPRPAAPRPAAAPKKSASAPPSSGSRPPPAPVPPPPPAPFEEGAPLQPPSAPRPELPTLEPPTVRALEATAPQPVEPPGPSSRPRASTPMELPRPRASTPTEIPRSRASTPMDLPRPRASTPTEIPRLQRSPSSRPPPASQPPPPSEPRPHPTASVPPAPTTVARGSEPPLPPAPRPLTPSNPLPGDAPFANETTHASEPPPSSGARHSTTTSGVSPASPLSVAASKGWTRWMLVSALLGVVAAGITWFALSSEPNATHAAPPAPSSASSGTNARATRPSPRPAPAAPSSTASAPKPGATASTSSRPAPR